MTDIVQQPTLFDQWTVIAPQYEPEMSISQRFELFHRENAHVYEALRELALRMKLRGMRRWSINGAFEVLRYEVAMHTSDPTSEFKLDNSYRALYARELMEREPELDGFFETRCLRSEQYA